MLEGLLRLNVQRLTQKREVNNVVAGKGRKFKFHGAFSSKRDAKRKERQTGGFIRRVKIRGSTRFVVMTQRGK